MAEKDQANLFYLGSFYTQRPYIFSWLTLFDFIFEIYGQFLTSIPLHFFKKEQFPIHTHQYINQSQCDKI